MVTLQDLVPGPLELFGEQSLEPVADRHGDRRRGVGSRGEGLVGLDDLRDVVGLEGACDHGPELLARADDLLQRVALFVGHRTESALEGQLGVAEDRRDPAPELVGEGLPLLVSRGRH